MTSGGRVDGRPVLEVGDDCVRGRLADRKVVDHDVHGDEASQINEGVSGDFAGHDGDAGAGGDQWSDRRRP